MSFFINNLQNKYGELHWWDFNDRATYPNGATFGLSVNNFSLKGSDSFFSASSILNTYYQPISGTAVSYPMGAITDGIVYVGVPYQNDGIVSFQSRYFEISTDPTQCGTTNSTNFPVLVNISYQSIKETSYGGYVYSNLGNDIRFWSNSTFTNPLNWEIESYDSSTGTLTVWVLLPYISCTISTIFYMTYGNQGYSTFGGGLLGSVWDSQYNEVWHFNNSFNNSTSIGGNGTASNGVSIQSSLINKGVSVPSGHIIDVPYNSASDITSKISISAWVYLTSLNLNTSLIVQKRDVSNIFGEMDWGFWILSDGRLLFEFYNSGLVNHAGTSALPTSVWTHIAVSVDETLPSNKISFYINGVLDSNPSYNSSFLTSSQPLQIGNYTSSDYNVLGILDEVRISNKSFGQEWFLTEYNNGILPGDPSTIGFLSYNYDETYQHAYIPYGLGFPIGSNAVSIGCWFRLSHNLDSHIVAIGGTGSNDLFSIKYDFLTSQLIVDMGGSGVYSSFTYDNKWHFVMATIPSSSNRTLVNLYLDGATASITQYGNLTSLFLPTSDFFIGAKPYTSGYEMLGDIKFPMLFNREVDFPDYVSFFNSTKVSLYENSGPSFKTISESPHILGYLDFGDTLKDGILSPMSVTNSESRTLFLTYNPTSPTTTNEVITYMIGDFDFSKVLRIFRSTSYSNKICIDNINSTVLLTDTEGGNETTILVIREINNGLRNIQLFNNTQYNGVQSITLDGNNFTSCVEGYTWFGAEPISNPLSPSNGQNFSNTKVKELIMIPTYLNDKETKQVVNYLKNKWKI